MNSFKSGYGLILAGLLATGSIPVQAALTKQKAAVGLAVTLGMGAVYLSKYCCRYPFKDTPLLDCTVQFKKTSADKNKKHDYSHEKFGAAVLTTLVGSLWYMLLKK